MTTIRSIAFVTYVFVTQQISCATRHGAALVSCVGAKRHLVDKQLSNLLAINIQRLLWQQLSRIPTYIQFRLNFDDPLRTLATKTVDLVGSVGGVTLAPRSTHPSLHIRTIPGDTISLSQHAAATGPPESQHAHHRHVESPAAVAGVEQITRPLRRETTEDRNYARSARPPRSTA